MRISDWSSDVCSSDLFKNDIDVLILCGGSKNDLPEQGPALAALFNTVDSYDTHAKIPEYFDAVNKSAESGDNIALISVGRSEEHTSELQSLMRISYAVFCLKKKKKINNNKINA